MLAWPDGSMLEPLHGGHPRGDHVWSWAFLALAAVALVAYVWLARQAAGGRARLGLTSALLLLTTPWLVVWYLAWPVTLAGSEDDRTAQWLTVALSVYLLPQAIPL